MRTFLIALILVLTVSSCDQPHDLVQETTKEGNYKVDLLFEKDGCKMYRFVDHDQYVYWSDCTGNTYQSYSVLVGKHHETRQYQTITTNNNK